MRTKKTAHKSTDGPRKQLDTKTARKSAPATINLSDQPRKLARKTTVLDQTPEPTKKRIIEYETIWRGKFCAVQEASTIEEMSVLLRAEADSLALMKADGVTLRDNSGDDYFFLTTTDAAVAAKYGMQAWHDEDDDE